MDIITISQKMFENDDLVIMPRKKYEQFLSIVKRQNQFDNDLDEAVGQVKQGKAVRPFCSAQELKKSLEKETLIRAKI